MVENPSDGSGDNGEGKAAPDSEAKSNHMSNNLPMVVAPKLGASEDEANETADSAHAAAASAARTHSGHFLMLAATVAFAAAFGSFVGSVSGSGLARYLYPPTAVPAAAMTADALREMRLDLAELSAIKAGLDAASRSTTSQFSKLSDRLDRLDQHTAAAATEITGSIATTPLAPSAAQAPKLADRILPDWVVQDVQDGRAVVASRYGGVFDVGAGSVLPGVGRVDAVKRQDGHWVVLTARGTITSGR